MLCKKNESQDIIGLTQVYSAVVDIVQSELNTKRLSQPDEFTPVQNTLAVEVFFFFFLIKKGFPGKPIFLLKGPILDCSRR